MQKKLLILMLLMCQTVAASRYTIKNNARIAARVSFKVITGADVRTRWIEPGQSVTVTVAEDVRFIRVRPMFGRGDTLSGRTYSKENDYTLYLVQYADEVHFLKRSVAQWL